LKGHKCSINNLKYLSDKYLISTSIDGILKVWDCMNGTCLKSLTLKEGKPYSLTIFDEKFIVIGLKTTIELYNFLDANFIESFHAHENQITALKSI
jgi:WD40 repeat protein